MVQPLFGIFMIAVGCSYNLLPADYLAIVPLCTIAAGTFIFATSN